MKIGITCYPSVGGSGIVATELGLKLAERGHEIHFITSNIPFRLNMTHPNIYIHQTDISSYSVFQYAPYDITLANKISDIIIEYDLDVIHMHYAVPHAICGILAKQIANRDVKIVTTLHGTDITVLGHDLTLKNAIKFGIEKSDLVTAVSNSLKDDTMKLIQPDQSIHTIYNFIDEKRFNMTHRKKIKQQMHKRYNIDENTKVMLHTSNFRQIKRIDDTIKTFNKVQKSVDSILILVGDGPVNNQMKKLVEKLNIADKVIFAGKQLNVIDYYLMSDVFILMSEKESFGLVLLEAMNCGAIPIGSNAGGISEVIKHQETGYIVNIGDYNQAAEHIIHLFNHPSLIEKMRENIIRDIHERFHSDEIISQYENLYKKELN